MYCGIDEAGRGPLIGPLVMAAVLACDADIPAGVRDSKLLSKARREELYEQLLLLPHVIHIVSAQEVDEAVFQNDLNWLEARHTAQIINKLAPKRAVLDCPSRNIPVYQSFVAQRCPGVEVHAQFKADVDFPVVAAASILAKVVRDRVIDDLQKQAGFDFGSGYLTDPKTQEFLTHHFDKYFIGFRKSWKPYNKRVAQDEQNTLF